MPVETVIDPERRLVTTQVTGHATAAEILAAQEKLRTDSAFDSKYHHLFDLSGAEGVDVAQGDVQSIAAVALFDPGSRRAVVAPANVLYGLSRMYQAFRDLADKQMQIFRTREEALAWLRETAPGDTTPPA